MVNIVSFFAPRPEHPAWRDYMPLLKILDESCRRFGHRHLVLTDASAVGELATFHAELPRPLMQAAIAAQLAYLRSPFAAEDTILVGADCVLAQDPAEIFAEAFDLAVTTDDYEDCILNTGAIFVRGGADVAPIWERALAACGEEWGDDQRALAAEIGPTLEHGLYERGGLKVRFLPFDPWNYAPTYPDHDCRDKRILHFRGQRKDWMESYCRLWLGLAKESGAQAGPNTPVEAMLENVRINAARGLPVVQELPAHDGHAVICGGGPSLADTVEEIRWRQSLGQHIFALNGAGRFLEQHGIVVDYQVVIDPRPENIRFLEASAARQVLLASQVHPSLIDAAREPTFFHCITEGIDAIVPPPACFIGGGIVSGLTAMCLAYTLGYRKEHLYGYDSSDRDGQAHAYDQAETDPEKRRLKAYVGRREFSTSYAMFKQAEAFEEVAMMLIRMDCTVTVHGDGLIPEIWREMCRRLAAAAA